MALPAIEKERGLPREESGLNNKAPHRPGFLLIHAGVAELVYAATLEVAAYSTLATLTGPRRACRFESCRPHSKLSSLLCIAYLLCIGQALTLRGFDRRESALTVR